MLVFLLKRIAMVPPMLFAVSVVAFLCLELVPGDAAQMAAGQLQDPETIAQIREKWGLDEDTSPVERYGMFLNNLLIQRDARNFYTGEYITEELFERFTATAELALAAMLIAALIGVNLGIAAGRRPGSGTSAASLALAYGGISVPIFWLAILSVGVFAVWLQVVPASGRLDASLLADFDPITGFYLLDGLLKADMRILGSALHHLILPAAVLATIPTAIVVRLTRASMIEELQKDYVRTARSKGLREDRVVRGHALKNAAIPILTATGAQFGYLLTGAVLTETVFAWPGLGSYVVEAAKGQNGMALMGGILLLGTIVVFVNLLVDVLYAVLDPRVRAGQHSRREGGTA